MQILLRGLIISVCVNLQKKEKKHISFLFDSNSPSSESQAKLSFFLKSIPDDSFGI